ncbi:hypothetical protein ACUXHY_001229 [Cytobacillus horneckiae]
MVIVSITGTEIGATHDEMVIVSGTGIEIG